MINLNLAYGIVHVAGRSAISLAGPRYHNAEASSAYRQLSGKEREWLKQKVAERGEKIFIKSRIW